MFISQQKNCLNLSLLNRFQPSQSSNMKHDALISLMLQTPPLFRCASLLQLQSSCCPTPTPAPAFYSPALYFSSTSHAWFTITIQNCLHLRSSEAVQWQLTLTIQSDKLKMMSQSQFKTIVHRKMLKTHWFVLCLLVWLHHNTHSPHTAVSMVLLLGQTLDQSQTVQWVWY